MSGSSGGATAAPMQQQQEPPVAPPFVAKTYRMVDDPSTDAVIAWGPAHNSFVVADPFALARALLPAYFNHRNFSSFVRQLNTYGFRKVDPDQWEFAHVSFLRGQTHLLHRVVRRRQRGRGGKRKHGHDAGAGGSSGSGSVVVDEEGTGTATATATAARLAMEVVRLRREHKANEELLAAMRRRVQEVERRPKQMLALFLAKAAAADPQALRRVLLAGNGGGGGRDGEGDNRHSAETEDSGPVKSARLFPDSDRVQRGSSGGDGDEAIGKRTDGVLGGGEDDFDFTGFLNAGGHEGGSLMPPRKFHADSGYWRLC